jgi:hypothetical protein
VTNPVNTISNFSSVTIAPAGTADFFRLTTP